MKQKSKLSRTGLNLARLKISNHSLVLPTSTDASFTTTPTLSSHSLHKKECLMGILRKGLHCFQSAKDHVHLHSDIVTFTPSTKITVKCGNSSSSFHYFDYLFLWALH